MYNLSCYPNSWNIPHSPVVSDVITWIGDCCFEISFTLVFSTFISIPQHIPVSINQSIMLCNTVSSLASSTRSFKFHSANYLSYSEPPKPIDSRSQWPRGLRCGATVARWDCGFESHRRYGCLSFVSVVRNRSLRRAYHSSRVVRLMVYLRVIVKPR